MRKILLILVLLGAGALLARYHVANQHYFPVSKLVSSDGYTFVLVQDRVDTREACGKANDRFLGPLKASCQQCQVAYARCERELHGLELALLMGDPVQVHVVLTPGARLAMEGPPKTLRRDCEAMATSIVKTGVSYAACVFPGTLRRP